MNQAQAWLDKYGIYCIARKATMHARQCEYERNQYLCDGCGYYINKSARNKPKKRFGSYGRNRQR